VMYAQGRRKISILQDDKEAIQWFEKSVAQNFADAQFNLGLMTAKGWGVPVNQKKAIQWFILAAEQGHKKSQAILDELFAKKQPIEEEKNEVLESKKNDTDEKIKSIESKKQKIDEEEQTQKSEKQNLVVFQERLDYQSKVDRSAYAGGDLNYQQRSDRWEGIKPLPVSGQDIELLSALAYHGEKWETTPELCKLKFYLPEQKAVNLTVRELKPKHFYWMDQVLPKPPLWKQGINEYQWPTKGVIEPLKLDISTLGVLVRLEREALNSAEKIAPVVFYHSEAPKKIKGYLFNFKVGSSAKLKYAIYKDNEKLIEKDLGKQFYELFRIFWDSSNANEGEYELRVEGYFLSDFMPIHHFHHSILFYHKKNF